MASRVRMTVGQTLAGHVRDGKADRDEMSITVEVGRGSRQCVFGPPRAY